MHHIRWLTWVCVCVCVCVSHTSVFMNLQHVHLQDLSNIFSLLVLIWQPVCLNISVLLFWLEITIILQRGDTGCWVYIRVILVSIMHAYEYVYLDKSLGCCALGLSWLGTRVFASFFVATNTIYQIESVVIFLHPCPCPNTWSDFPSIVSRLILWAVYFWVIFIHHYYDSLAVSLLLYSVFLLVFLSHLNSTRSAPSPLSPPHNLYTHATPHAFTNIHTRTHTVVHKLSPPPQEQPHTHTHARTHTRCFSGSGAWQEQVTAP